MANKKTKISDNINNIEDILDSTVREIKERFGEGSIMKLGDARHVDVDVIPTGSPSLNIALGVGGIPRGRIIEIYGAESSGKTTLALHIVAEIQKKGEVAAYIDAEHALDPEYAKKIGVNIKNLLISQPDNGEQALEIVETLVKSGAVSLIVVDSVAALTPLAEIEGEMSDQQIGLQARLMSKALRKLTALSAKVNTTIIFINQTRMQIQTMAYGNPETTPGGKALKFYTSVRIELKRIAQIKKGEDVVGNRIRAKVVKNKVAAPFKIAEFDIMYNEGISYSKDLLGLGIKYNIVKRTGTTYFFNDIKLGVGLDAASEAIKTDSKLAKELFNQIQEKSVANI
ncbi:MAG TPA: recombinase RecA [Candidatus Paceibacterota bacterium]|jgi:recombination protein RecA|nr:recombinase RecA [Candidatus Paceibacterota bacterium]HRV32583.1 recombinase RecA [Candidatus Paceibacterota bacterium]